jgi:hypothetical protein
VLYVINNVKLKLNADINYVKNVLLKLIIMIIRNVQYVDNNLSIEKKLYIFIFYLFYNI